MLQAVWPSLRFVVAAWWVRGTRWWPTFCAAGDFVTAGILAIVLLSGVTI